MNEELLWFDQQACQQVEQVGSKAANLAHLATDFPVPLGFCLNTAAFERWSGDASETALPEPLQAKLRIVYAQLAERCQTADPPVAVRSSAVDEDGVGTSFAGQYETFLNIVGPDALIEAVARCWASATSERVRAYRQSQGQETDSERLAVLIQHLVISDVSAVAFSINPITDNRDEIVINASWGLGESLVGGTVTPDNYVIHKSDLTVAKVEIAAKERMTIMAPDGVREVSVPRPMQCLPALDDGKATEIAQMARALEAKMGWPVDIECAYHQDKLYLLQCRPITTLSVA